MHLELQKELDVRINRWKSSQDNCAFITVSAEYLARQVAELHNKDPSDYPLFGLYIGVKDNICTSELPTTAGTPALRHWRPKHNAPVVQKLLDSGCILFGKTSMHELAFGVTNSNISFGIARNPANPECIPGGSSGGSAIAVTCQIVPVALGTDTAGSVRIPASFCGCVGFKPSFNRYSREGVVPLALSRDTVGLLACSVDEIMRVDAVLCEKAAEEKEFDDNTEQLRIGIPRNHFYQNVDPNVLDVVEKYLRFLRDELRITLVEEDWPFVDKFIQEEHGSAILNYECYRNLLNFLKENDCPFSMADIVQHTEDEAIRGKYTAKLDATDYLQDLELGKKLQHSFRSYFADHNVSLAAWPTVKIPACPIGAIENKSVSVRTITSNTHIGSVVGFPAISLPIGVTEDKKLPVGIEIVALPGEDRLLLQCAKTLLHCFQNKCIESSGSVI